MSRDRVREFVRSLERRVPSVSDGALLRSFVTGRDGSAFAELVARHGPMVMGVCRRVLGNQHDAEDAFQATFLVLARKADTVRPAERVGNWLHGVATRTALKARTLRVRQRLRDRMCPRDEAVPDRVPDDLSAVLDQEIQRLPTKYQTAVLLCDVQGKTRSEAAQSTGWPEGTVATRLQRGRRLLADRLRARGIELGLMMPVFEGTISSNLVVRTVRAGVACVLGGEVPVGTVPIRVEVLVGEVLMAMRSTKLRQVLVAVLAVGVLGVGVGLGMIRAQEDPVADPVAKPSGQPVDPNTTPVPTRPGAKMALRLPTGPAPEQVLVRLDDEGQVCISRSMNTQRGRMSSGPMGGMELGGEGYGGMVSGGSAGVSRASGQPIRMYTTRYDPKKLEIADVSDRKIDPALLADLLPRETVALFWEANPGEKFDPLHLRLYKEGTLVFAVRETPSSSGYGVGGSSGGGRSGGGGFSTAGTEETRPDDKPQPTGSR